MSFYLLEEIRPSSIRLLRKKSVALLCIYKHEKIDYDTIDSFHRRCSFVA